MIGLSLSYITYALCMLKGSFLEGDSAAQFHTGLNIEEKVNYSYNDYRFIVLFSLIVFAKIHSKVYNLHNFLLFKSFSSP